MARYVPKRQRSEEEWESYLESCRERNRRYYYRKKYGIERTTDRTIDIVRNPDHTVSCLQCGEEVVPICGFCRNGVGHE